MGDELEMAIYAMCLDLQLKKLNMARHVSVWGGCKQ